MNTIKRKKKPNKGNCLLPFLIFGFGIFSFNQVKQDFVGSSQTNKNSSSDATEKDDSLASSQSFGFFDGVSNSQWELLQKITAEHNNHHYPDLPLTHNPAFDKRNKKYFNSVPAWWQNVRRSCIDLIDYYVFCWCYDVLWHHHRPPQNIHAHTHTYTHTAHE